MNTAFMQILTGPSASTTQAPHNPIHEYIKFPSRIERICKVTGSTNEVSEILSNNHDVGYIHSIVVPLSHSLTFSDHIVIKNANTRLWHMPLKLLEGMYGSTLLPHMTPPMKRIKLPEHLCPIFTLAHPWYQSQITLKCCENAYLTYAKIFLDGDQRRDLATRPLEYDIVSCSSIVNDKLGTENRRHWGGPTIGLFVDTNMAPSYGDTIMSINNSNHTLTPDIAEPLPYSSSTLYYSLIGDVNPLNAMNSMNYTQSSLDMSRIFDFHMQHNSRSSQEHGEDGEDGEQVQCFVLTRHTLFNTSVGIIPRFLNYNYGTLTTPATSTASTASTSAPAFTHRPILQDEDAMCCITMTIIGDNAKYAKCGTCRKNFIHEPFLQWYRSHRNCPMCRSTGLFTYHCNEGAIENDSDNPIDDRTPA